MEGFTWCSIMADMVRIINSLWLTGDDRTLPLLLRSLNKVELDGVLGRPLRLRYVAKLLLLRP
jgi:hypothetical protein